MEGARKGVKDTRPTRRGRGLSPPRFGASSTKGNTPSSRRVRKGLLGSNVRGSNTVRCRWEPSRHQMPPSPASCSFQPSATYLGSSLQARTTRGPSKSPAVSARGPPRPQLHASKPRGVRGPRAPGCWSLLQQCCEHLPLCLAPRRGLGGHCVGATMVTDRVRNGNPSLLIFVLLSQIYILFHLFFYC